jgi:TPR repeat protein
MRAALAVAIMVGFAAAVAPAHGDDDPAYDRAAMARVEALLDGDPQFAERYAACPGDLFAAERPFFGDLAKDIRVETCEADPEYCHATCTQGQSGGACLKLARAMQDNEPETKARYYEGLFTQACALGEGSGCTNRGGGIRNGVYADDPFRDAGKTMRDACLFRTFTAACGNEDAWGCAMLGQAYQYGEGTQVNEVAALRHFRQSCEIDPDFAACHFAEDHISNMTGEEEEDPDDGQEL